MNPQEDQQFNELIGTIMADDVPTDMDRQMRAKLTSLRLRLGTVDESTVARAATWKPVMRSVAATAVAVTLVLAAIIGWGIRPRLSFADVTAAVLTQPWIHVTTTDPDGTTNETWYSPLKDISARRYEGWIEYFDHRLKIYYSYDVADKVLYRVPEYSPRRANQLAAMAGVLPLLLQDEQSTGKHDDRKKFLGDVWQELEILDQKLQKVDDAGKQWLEFELIVRHEGESEPVQILFRGDPQTRLPYFCRIEGRSKGDKFAIENRIEYPEQGPVDVYDLGVPKKAMLVDRVPSDDIERMLETIRAGRERMDDYRATVVTLRDPLDYEWWTANTSPMILYRKDGGFRTDFAFWRGELRKVNQPADDQDMADWWRRRADDFLYYPVYIVRRDSDKRSAPFVNRHFVMKVNDSHQREVESINKWNVANQPGENYPPDWARRPEFICRPPLGIPSQIMEPVLELHPTSGPPNTVLLHVRRSGRFPQAQPDPDATQLPPQPDAYRFWLDPARDYVVVRSEMLGAGDSGAEEITSSTVIEKMARSPEGVWYATQAKITGKVPGGESVEVVHIYPDFDTELPDTLFKLPTVGQIY